MRRVLMKLVLRNGSSSIPAEYGKSIVQQLGVPVRTMPFYDAVTVHMSSTPSDELHLSTEPVDRSVPLVLGRSTASAPGSQTHYGVAVPCPVHELQERGINLPPRHTQPRVGVVVLPFDPATDRVLITRRASSMRTFPRAWVFPGGSVDAGETTEEAGAREVFEETGLRVDPSSMEPLGLWESVFPTSADLCVEKGQVLAHFLVVFYKAVISSPDPVSSVRLQCNEVDSVAWVSESDWLAACCGGRREIPGGSTEGVLSSDHTATVPCTETIVSPEQLHGIYPNEKGEGVGQGHLFVIDSLYGLHDRLRTSCQCSL